MTAPPPPASIRHSRRAVLCCGYALLGWLAVNNLLTFDGLAATLFIWLLQGLPLLLLLPGLHHCHPRSYLWTGLLVLAYFSWAVTLAFDPSRRWSGLVGAGLCCLLFVLLVVTMGRLRSARR